ncbi:MAG TPA: hypothetical protein VN442_12755 [Bryobacteraceae bacterium]|nr:hypothetical protein [Bryobacteraceae bacterium]
MAEETAPVQPSSPMRSKDEIALELMKFITVTTGYGKGGATPSAGFSGKPATRGPDDHVDALLELFERCRRTVNKEA